MKELESRKTSDADNCILTPDGETCYVVDVMNCLRKLVKKDKQIFGAIAEAYCAYTASICRHSGRIDHVFDSYHELSPKDCERLRRKTSAIIELQNVDFDVRLPVQMETFWPSSKNKLLFQKFTIDYFTTMLIDKPTSTKHVFSAFSGPSHDIIQSCTSIVNDQHNIVSDLDCFSMEEADFRMIVHAQHAAAHGFTQFVFVTADTDVFILCLFHWKRLHVFGVQELWIRTGIGDSTRIIPVHVLVETLGLTLCSVYQQFMLSLEPTIPENFALNCNPVQFLPNFGIAVDDCDMLNSMKKAEEYLVQLWKRGH